MRRAAFPTILLLIIIHGMMPMVPAAAEEAIPLGIPRINIPVLVSSGNEQTCARRTDGSVGCWGSNALGQLNVPAELFDDISAGGTHTCGITNSGSTLCWGDNAFNQTTVPAANFVDVSSGWKHNCGIRANDSITCWGDNADGQSNAPNGNFTDVSAGGLHTCAVRENQNVACWGANGDGQSTPPAGSFVDVTAGGFFSCAVDNANAVTCWGANGAGQSTPPGGSFTTVTSGNMHACGLRLNGSVDCWGDNTYGQRNAPSRSDFVSVSAGRFHTCAVRQDNVVQCWGDNTHGQTTIPLPEVTLSAASDELTEETGLIAITATLSERPLQHVTVTLGFDGSATNGDDYTTSGVSMQINPDNSSSSVLLFAIDDDDEEANEEIEIDITNVVNGTEAGTQQVVVSIPASDQPVNQIVNGGFEHDPSDPAPWVVKNGTKDKVKCNTSSPRVNSGSCAFQFKGSVGENSSLQQKVTPPAGAAFYAGDKLELRLYAKGSAGTAGKVMLKVAYTDGTPPDKISANLPTTGSYTPLNGELTLSSPNVDKIKVAIKHQSISGKTLIDDVELIHTSVITQNFSGQLPLP